MPNESVEIKEKEALREPAESDSTSIHITKKDLKKSWATIIQIEIKTDLIGQQSLKCQLK